MSELPRRKVLRLKGFDYSSPGAYFITVCTKGRRKRLSRIDVGTDVLGCPKNTLLPDGEIADRQLRQMSDFYAHLKFEKYVIMPNHIHLLLHITEGGPSGTPVPTASPVAAFVGTFKRLCNKEYGENIWQPRSYDHIIRGEEDYRQIWEYIDTNVQRWEKDRFYEET